MKWYLIVVLICLSLMTNDVEYLFLCLLVISISLKKCPFISLPILIGLVGFLLLSCKSFCTFCIQILYQSHEYIYIYLYPSNPWVLFAISSWCPLQHKGACYYYFHYSFSFFNSGDWWDYFSEVWFHTWRRLRLGDTHTHPKMAMVFGRGSFIFS